MIRPQSCPVCEKILAVDAGAGSRFFPFCCERCQQIDMYRWCVGKYAIAEPIDPNQIEQGEAGETLSE